MNTKATTMRGSDVENKIETLDFFFYPQGATESNSTYYKRVSFEGGILDEADVHLYITDAEFSAIFPQENQNNCVVFVIANLPEESLPAEDDSTTLQALKQIRLDEDFIDEGGNPVTPTSFVMQGEKTLTRSSNTANSVTGEVELKRAASKITLRLKLPDYILVPIYDKDGNPLLEQGQIVNQVWVPEFSASGPTGGLGHTFASLRNGVSADYLAGEYTPISEEYFNTIDVSSFTYESSAESYADNSSGAKIHTYSCDMTFYSYSSEWESGDMNAPCFILRIPWKTQDSTGDNYVTHYYQVQINSFGKELAPNHWYELTLNVGVLGSTVATLPMEIQTCSYKVLDWSSIVTVFDKEEEDIHLDEWQYLIIDETQVVMNNKSKGTFYFDASHNLAWNLEWPDQKEFEENGYNNLVSGFDELERMYNLSTKYASYYLDCSKLNASPVCLNSGNTNVIHNGCFSVDGRTFNFEIPDDITDQSKMKIYSPVYVHVKVWLDMDNDDELDDNEKDHVYHLTFVYNPAMYITPDPSTLRSVYVNGVRNYNTTQLTPTYLFRQNNTNYYPLGYADGVRNFEGDNEYTNFSMYSINVTSFDAGDTFQAPALNANGCLVVPNGTQGNPGGTPTTQPYKYIIGDPRQRTSDINLDGGDIANHWATAQALYPVNGSTNRKLKYYYPTESFGNSFQVIAPKFRIVSFNNASGKECTAVSAAMRCASLQEDGFPAGRWRLPTVAEVQYIIFLQGEDVIQEIFSSSSSCYATASYGNTDKTRRITLSLNENNNTLIWNNVAEKISVRCVYDEWYWGSEREAIPNTGQNPNTDGDEYLFTWGDKLIY